MRLLHTSDWHLGHSLHGVGREREHAAFLRWLVDVIDRERIDAVVITGDVFDGSTPPASAEAMWFRFLAEARGRRAEMPIVVIAGNHDSPARLAAPAPLLEAMGVRVIANVPRDPSELVVVVGGAVIAAVPFLRPIDLPASSGHDDPMEAVRAVYADALAAARARRRGRPIVATGHLFVAGASPSWMSERRIISGGQEAIDATLFDADVAYVALGHLHRAQKIGGREHVRYAGSPIPLAMVEAEYRHQIAIAELEPDAPARVRTIEIPRAIELLRLPRHGAASLDDAVAAIASLPEIGDEEPETRPFLEVVVALERPEPRLRDRIEAAVAGRAVRLVKITAQMTGDRAALGDVNVGKALADLDPREVLQRRWSRDHEAALPASVARAFEELLAEAEAR
ncbi:MAG TPA: exonuclease SbcCD subunit D C-terminal domain-containing protein [Kofleriaceae bacterium]|nr:exonuclease SbcCD subunit D C-terminal domain-containing protein [Kofleriaceae bacterium]